MVCLASFAVSPLTQEQFLHVVSIKKKCVLNIETIECEHLRCHQVRLSIELFNFLLLIHPHSLTQNIPIKHLPCTKHWAGCSGQK